MSQLLLCTWSVCFFVLGDKNGPTQATSCTELLPAELMSTAVLVQTGGLRVSSYRQTHRQKSFTSKWSMNHLKITFQNPFVYCSYKSCFTGQTSVQNTVLVLEQWNTFCSNLNLFLLLFTQLTSTFVPLYIFESYYKMWFFSKVYKKYWPFTKYFPIIKQIWHDK